jgi:hypothetical protein
VGITILAALGEVMVGVSSGGLPRQPLSKTELRAATPAVAIKRRREMLYLKSDIISFFKLTLEKVIKFLRCY